MTDGELEAIDFTHFKMKMGPWTYEYKRVQLPQCRGIMNLYLMSFNNYYNRIVKYYNSILQYNEFVIGSALTGINFNPNDDVTAEQIINWPTTNARPDYVVMTDDLDNIVSRWFIMEQERLRNGQYRLRLRRDVVADHFDAIKIAPCFIKKATLSNNDPFIFNSEDMTFNQIKANQEYIKDRSGCAWIVGYIPLSLNTSKTINLPTRNAYDFSIADITTWEYYRYCDVNPNRQVAITDQGISYDWSTDIYKLPYSASTSFFGVVYTPSTGTYSGSFTASQTSSTAYSVKFPSSYSKDDVLREYVNAMATNYSTIANMVPNYITGYAPQDYAELGNYNNKVIYDSVNNKYYRIHIVSEQYTERKRFTQSTGALWQEWKNRMASIPNVEVSNSIFVDVDIDAAQRRIVLEEVQAVASTLTIGTQRYYLEDAPYYMFCIPYSDTLQVKVGGALKYTASKDFATILYSRLVEQLVAGTSGNLYDIQLLPYCPVPEFLDADGNINIPSAQESGAISYALDNANKIGGMIWCRNSTGNIIINKSIPVNEIKIEAQTDFCRLCSPDYGSVYEFVPAKNYGVSQINIDYQYRPFNPYIHINPVYNSINGLYGRHNYEGFNDPVGLICTGDFTLPTITSAIEQYELNNKNYLNIFNRQIENMEVNNRIANINNIANAIGGVAGGIGAGALAGGPIGAIVGGIGSAITGGIDVANQIALQQEAIDYTKDQFNYSLGNIKALPNTLTRVTSFTPNNPVFPYIEYYTCTVVEKQALRDKIKYNGMTVMRIGKIEDYIIEGTLSYIQGQLIRLEGISDDFHMANEIANEINKGVFI